MAVDFLDTMIWGDCAMEWNVILTSVVVSTIISAGISIITTRMNNHAKRRDFSFAKLYDIFVEIQAFPKPNAVIGELTMEDAKWETDYHNFLQNKFTLAQPLLSDKLAKEVAIAHEKCVNLTVNLIKGLGDDSEDSSEKAYLMRIARIEFERKLIENIQKQLSQLK